MTKENITSEYADLNLEEVIRQYIKENMKKKDWTIHAIDPVKNLLVLKRLNLQNLSSTGSETT